MNISLKCKNKFWFENIYELFCSTRIIPSFNMSIECQYNAITRIVIIIFLFMLIFRNSKESIIFLILSLLFIIIVYYIQKKTMNQKESYQNTHINKVTQSYKNADITYINDLTKNFLTKNTSNNTALTKEYPIITGPDFVSSNQKLAGKPNPKTLIPPVVVAPPMDLEYWRKNNLVNHSHINIESNFDEYLSGYKTSDCNNLIKTQIVQQKNKDYDIIEPFENSDIRRNQYGMVNTSCGYNSSQIANSNIPSNLQVGNCELSPQLKDYNKNLFTQNIQPDIFTYNEIIEPINSNIGISFNQQFNPLTSFADKHGVNYIEHDPLSFSKESKKEHVETAAEYNMYDPRFTGYGTSYRSYNDNNLGQTKFYYDDVNSIRMPNYITRTNIDFALYADSYGPLSDKNKNGNINTHNIRQLAQDSFLNANIEQRESLSESLMRKRNSELWQLRKYPIRTFG